MGTARERDEGLLDSDRNPEQVPKKIHPVKSINVNSGSGKAGPWRPSRLNKSQVPLNVQLGEQTRAYST